MFKKYSHSNTGRSGGSNFSQSRNRRTFGKPAGRFSGNHSGGGRRSGNGMRGEYINPSRFINKAIITEETAHFTPEHSFNDFAIEQSIKNAIVKKGYTSPTPIQDKTIPHILMGKDVVGIANTGTGKTGAFLIPLIDKVLKNKTEKVLIIVPTRELAIQIDSEFRTLAIASGLFSVCVVGGMSIVKQMRDLRYQNHFIIGTPGRLKDLIDRKCITLSTFKTVVLDEADRMLDMGFIHDMRFVMAGMSKNRQTLFFSATLSSEIEKLIGEFLREPVKISVKTGDTARNVEQDVVSVGRDQNKLDVLRDLLMQKEFNKVLIFGRTKHGVEKLSQTLANHGFKAESIHGNKPHGKRQKALGLFRDSQIQILVATDVAARGLDIPNVTHVINYDIPATHDDYVHRIGRTGRGEKRGKALTFIG